MYLCGSVILELLVFVKISDSKISLEFEVHNPFWNFSVYFVCKFAFRKSIPYFN